VLVVKIQSYYDSIRFFLMQVEEHVLFSCHSHRFLNDKHQQFFYHKTTSTTSTTTTEDVVECKMDLPKGVGSLACRMCSASYQMPIHHLHEPVDVFSEWLDDCEAAERGEVAAAAPSASSSSGRRDLSTVVHDTNRDYDDDDDDDDDDLPEASGLGQKKRMATNNLSASSKGMEETGNGEDNGVGGTKKSKNAVVSSLGLDDSENDDNDDSD
jgi:transcription elongation factor Elf1